MMLKWCADSWGLVELWGPLLALPLDKGAVQPFYQMWTALGVRRHLVGVSIQDGMEDFVAQQPVLCVKVCKSILPCY